MGFCSIKSLMKREEEKVRREEEAKKGKGDMMSTEGGGSNDFYAEAYSNDYADDSDEEADYTKMDLVRNSVIINFSSQTII